MNLKENLKLLACQQEKRGEMKEEVKRILKM